MRKGTYVLLGLLLVIGAVGAAGWRHVIEPSRSVSRSTSNERLAPATRSDRSVTRSFSGDRTRTQTQTRLSTWDAVDMIVNVLNAVVGIVGIWLAISGMRMQRDAAAAHARSQAAPFAGRER
jgi:hypothetical protein